MAGAQREYGGAMSSTHLMWARGGVRSMGICRGQDRREPIHGGFGKNIHVFDDPGRDKSPSTGHPRVTTSDERHASPRCSLRIPARTAWTPTLTVHVAVRAAPKTPAGVSARCAGDAPVSGPWATGCRPRSPHGWVHGVPETGASPARRARGLANSFFAVARPAP